MAIADETKRFRCYECGASVSSPQQPGAVLRAVATCPECTASMVDPQRCNLRTFIVFCWHLRKTGKYLRKYQVNHNRRSKT